MNMIGLYWPFDTDNEHVVHFPVKGVTLAGFEPALPE